MNPSTLLKISVETSPEAEDAVAELLGRLFGQSTAVYTDEETKISVASVYCPARGAWNRARRAALAAGLDELHAGGLDAGAGTISARRVKREDWAESWKRHFKPIVVGARLLIKPSWVRRRPRRGQAVVVLDPGLSFGTGNHPTTAFCLGEVVACRQPGKSQAMLDIGTGSGILAIAAAKLGYSPVQAIDFDAEAVRVARANARQNGVLGRISIARRDVTKLPLHTRQKHHLICANLISDLLLRERDRLVNRLRPDGTLVLAGILRREFAGVRRHFEKAGLKLTRTRADGEWQSGAFAFPIAR